MRSLPWFEACASSSAGFVHWLLGWALAQSLPAHADSATSVTIGHSAARLYGPWKFTAGDSPLDPATHQPLWAEPGFDDSKWETVDLTPTEGAYRSDWPESPAMCPAGRPRAIPATGAMPGIASACGWTAQPGEKLAIAGPADMDDAYELFANGSRLGSFGDFSAQPARHLLHPADDLSAAGSGRRAERGTLPSRTARPPWSWPSASGWSPTH